MKPGGWRQVMGSQGAVQGRLRNPLTQDTVTHVTLQRPELRVELGAEVLLPGQPTSTHPIRTSSAGSSSRSLSAQKSRLVCPGDPNLQPPALGLPLFSLRLPPLRVLLSCFWPQVPRADRGVRARRNPPSTGSSTWRAEHQPTAPHFQSHGVWKRLGLYLQS